MGVLMLSPAHDTTIVQGTKVLQAVLYSPVWTVLCARNANRMWKRHVSPKSSLNCSKIRESPQGPQGSCTLIYTKPVTCSGSGSVWNSIKMQTVGFSSNTFTQCKPNKSIALARNSRSFIGVVNPQINRQLQIMYWHIIGWAGTTQLTTTH